MPYKHFCCFTRQQYEARIEDLESKLDSAMQQHEKEKVKAEVQVLKLKEELIELRYILKILFTYCQQFISFLFKETSA